VNGVDDLRNELLLKRPEVFYRIFAQNLMAYALGRRVEYYDMPAIRDITRAAAKQDYRVSAFILGIVNAPAFTTSRAGDAIVAEAPVTYQ